MKWLKLGSNPVDYSYYKDSECPLMTFTDTHLIKLRPRTTTNSKNSIQKMLQKNGENKLISNIKHIMKRFVQVTPKHINHMQNRGLKDVSCIRDDYLGDGYGISKHKRQIDSRFFISSRM